MWKKPRRSEKLLNLSPDSIRPPSFPVRRREPGSDAEKLAASIGRYGMLQPLTVRAAGGGYELVLGERRLRAAKAAGLEKVPCRVLSCSQREAVELCLEENGKRRDLDLFEEAEALEVLLRHYRLTQGELASRLGQSQSAVANKLRLLRFTPEERRIILENCLTERCARTLLRIQEEKARRCALDLVVERGYTVRQTESLVEAMLEHPEEFVVPRGAPRPPRPIPRPVRKLVVKDVRLFLNSVDKAIFHMREAGVAIEAEKEEAADHFTYRIRVPKA